MEFFKLDKSPFENLTLLPFFSSLTIAEGRRSPVFLPSTGKPTDRLSRTLTNPKSSVSTWERFAF